MGKDSPIGSFGKEPCLGRRLEGSLLKAIPHGRLDGWISRLASSALLLGLLGLFTSAPGHAAAAEATRIADNKARLPELVRSAYQRFSSAAKAAKAGELEVEGDPESGVLRKIRGALTPPSERRPSEIAGRFLRDHGDLFSLKKGLDLDLESEKESPAGYHVRFKQLYGNIPVYGSQVSVHLDLDGRVRVVNNRYRPIAKAPVGENISEKAAVNIARNRIRIQELRGDISSSQLIYPRKDRTYLIWQVTIPATDPLGDWEVLVDATTGEVLEVHDRLWFADGVGRVFDPNPVAVLGDPFLTDKNDSDYPELQGAYESVVLQGLEGDGFLKGPYVDTGLTSNRVREPSLNFNYNRSQPGFEEVMAYYHLDTYQRYIQGVLGFSQVNHRVQAVNARFGDIDNSFYSPATKEISFGLGGVDDAEDADVILHEYGHSIQDNVVPGFGKSDEARAIGEGFSDYIAASFFAARSLDDACLAEWDVRGLVVPGEPLLPCLRRLDSSKHYPKDLTGEPHADGEIWSAVLWQIGQQLGQVDADRLIFQSNFFLDVDENFRGGANAILDADQLLFGGVNQGFLHAVFQERGILGPALLPPDAFEENDSLSEAAPIELPFDQDGLTIDSPGDDDFYQFDIEGGKVKVEISFVNSRGDLDLFLFDAEGNLVQVSDSTRDKEEFTIDRLNPGTYVVRVAGFLGAVNRYRIKVSQEVGPGVVIPIDRFEENDSLDNAATISLPFENSQLSIEKANDDDYYKFTLSEDTRVSFRLSFLHAQGDLDLLLLERDPKPRKNQPEWREIATSRSSFNNENLFDLELGPGSYAIRVTGYEGAVNTYAMEVTAEPVVSGTGVIDGGAKYATKGQVTMDLSFNNATHVRFSNIDPESEEAFRTTPKGERKMRNIWSGWSQVNGKPKKWRLSKGDGEKTVWVQFRNQRNQISSVVRDTIILDATRPTGSLFINRGADTVPQSQPVTLQCSAQDVTTGVGQMRIANALFSDQETGWVAYTSIKTGWTLEPGEGIRSVFVQYRDRAGNVSKVYRDNIKVE